MIDWTLLHGGALGDLVLTVQLALRLPRVRAGSTLRLVSRVDPGDLSNCWPPIERVSPEGLGVHWLYGEGDESPPRRLRELVAGRRVLNALGDVGSRVHRRLLALGARAVYSFDPRPKPGLDVHITKQWQHELEQQGLLFPKCTYQGRGTSTLFVPDGMRERGRALWKQVSDSRQSTAGTETGCYSPTAGGGTGRYSPTAGTETGRDIADSAPILIHPGSGGRAKCWPLRCFLDVGRRLQETGREVCFVVGPVEVDRWAAADLHAIRVEFPLTECPGPDELLSLLAAGLTLISNDVGPAHLASLLGTPTLTIFGPTSATLWRPLGMKARVIQRNPKSHPEDWGIDPRRVVEEVTI
ncbi:MAG: glycosyltransferase family 9 protein [Phycisphaerae bacterium]